MRSVGYRQVLACLQGECDHEEMKQRGIAATRQLAKRQLTWMRQQRGLLWLEASAGKAADTLCTYLDACHQ
jgi:tRNA dimethylallyltransferase